MIGHLYRYPHPNDPTRFIYVGQGLRRDKEHRGGRSSFGRRFKRDFPGVELPQPIREQIEVSDQLELNEEETIQMFRFHTWRGYDGGMNLRFPGDTDYKNLVTFEQRVENGAKGGRIAVEGGRIAVESGQLANARNLPQAKIAQLENGRINGYKSVESGHWARVQNLPQTKEARRLNGHIQGRKSVESGHLASIRTPESCAKGGRGAVESGQLASVSAKGARKRNEIYGNPRTTEGSIKGGRIGSRKTNHILWHVRRSIIEKGCKFCEVL